MTALNNVTSILTASEASKAQIGPRQLKDPTSREFAIQTLYSLKRYLDMKEADEQRVRAEISCIKQNRHWEVLGYATMDDYLKGETGRSLSDILGEVRQNNIEYLCELAEAMGELKNGGDRNPEGFNQHNKQSGQRYNCNADQERARGNDKLYLTRRLYTEDRDVFFDLKAGKYRSVRAAAIDAKIIKVNTAQKRPPLEQAQALIATMPDTAKIEIWQELGRSLPDSFDYLGAAKEAAMNLEADEIVQFKEWVEAEL